MSPVDRPSVKVNDIVIKHPNKTRLHCLAQLGRLCIAMNPIQRIPAVLEQIQRPRAQGIF